jgi:hypothetical protein
MVLTDQQDLLLNWKSIEVNRTTVVSDSLDNNILDVEVVRDYFNFLFGNIVPWVNEYHPSGISQIHIPHSFPGIVNIEKLSMKVEKNFISLGLNPEFLV